MQILIETIADVKEEELEKKPDYITEKRWEKIQSLRAVEDKKRSLAAGRLLARMCKELAVENPVYQDGEKGKPYIKNCPDIAFNLSHSGEYVTLAYHPKSAEVGIDIQKIRKLSEGMQKRILHPKEITENSFHEMSEDEKNLFQNRIWAIKESYVKMTGEGLSHDFRNIYTEIEKGVITDESGRSAMFFETDAPQGYVIAVAEEKHE